MPGVAAASVCLLFCAAQPYAADISFRTEAILEGKQQTAAQTASGPSFTMAAVWLAAPNISTVTPSSMPADSTFTQTLTINGNNFQSGATLTFDPPTGPNINSNSAKLTFVSSNRLNYEFNNGGLAGTWTVRVNNADGQISNAVSFLVTTTSPAPNISTVTPSSMPADSTFTQTLTINGNSFKSGATLTFVRPTGANLNSDPTKLTFVSSNRLNYEFNNAGLAGTWTVRVNNPDGQISNSVSFLVTTTSPAPNISTVTPPSMPADSTINQTLTINGNSFKSGATLTFVRPSGANLNSDPTKLTFVSSNRFSYELNNGGNVGTWTVRVNNPDGQTSNAGSFTVTGVLPAPNISTVTPTSMPADWTINQTLTINGNNFSSGGTLTFDPPTGPNIDSTASKLTFVSSNRFNYELNNGGFAGTWTVRVNNPDGRISNQVSFLVTASSPAPNIGTVTPPSMPADSTINQTLTINGNSFKSGATLTFDPPTGANINSTAGNLTFVSSNRFSYELNNGADVGTWTVTVNNPDGQTSNAVSFTVTGVLPISAVTPQVGRASGGQQVKLNGLFDNLSAVMIGGISVPWSSNGISEITLTTPPHAPGAVSVDLIPASGSGYSKSNAFVYLPTVFTDDSLVAGVTRAKAQHITELRQAVDALRAVAGLEPAPWTNPVLSPLLSSIRSVHIIELRTFLEDVAVRLGYPAASYTDPALNAGFVVRRVHIEELRQRIRAIAG
jgi:PBP1b-binding outer membrane lipoprotein LpoB